MLGHPGGGNLYKIGPNKFMGGGGRGVVGGLGRGCLWGIVGGSVHFVWYAFFTIKKCLSLAHSILREVEKMGYKFFLPVPV